MDDDPVPPADGELTVQEAEAILRKLAGRQVSSAGGPAPVPDAPPPHGPAPAPVPDSSPALDLGVPAGTALARLIDAVPDGLVVVDGSGRIVLVNAQTEQLFGYPRSDLIGRTIEILIPERFRHRHVHQRDHFF